jgi:hypothetical protein
VALDFPNSPIVGQIFPTSPAPGTPQFRWDGTAWSSAGIQPTSGAVRYDTAQSLTVAQQVQARANIGALKRNYIINGAMMVSQQNGSTVLASGGYAADQFNVIKSNAGTTNIQQAASPTPAGSPNRLRVMVTAADTVVDPTDYSVIYQPFEGLRVADLQFGTASAKGVTIQFGVRAPAGTYSIVYTNNTNPVTNYVAEYTIAAGEANTDVVKSVFIPGNPTGTWPKDNTYGGLIYWSLMCGSTYQQAAGSWVAGSTIIGSPNQFNFMGTVNNIFELFDVGMYEGSVAPPFQVPDYASELQVCRRYWEKTALVVTTNPGTGAFPTGYWSVKKRVAPTLTQTSIESGSGASYGNLTQETTSGFYQSVANSAVAIASVSGDARL